jgi:hypothetical protein
VSVATVTATQGAVQGVQVGTSVITATTTWYGVTKSSSLTMQIGNPIFFQWVATPAPSVTIPGQYTFAYPPNDFRIGVGGIVAFAVPIDVAYQGAVMDVIFDDTTAAQPISSADSALLLISTGSGNVRVQTPVLAPGDTSFLNLLYACYPYLFTTGDFLNFCAATRSFPRAGRYAWHSALWGVKGTITVTEP